MRIFSEVTLRIEGMHCGACIRRVTQSLSTLPGTQVKEVRLGAARVEVPENVTVAELTSRLRQAGFAASED